MRDNVCSVIISFVGFLHLLLITHKEEFDVRHYEVAADIPELVSTLMQVADCVLKYFESLLFVPTQFRFFVFNKKNFGFNLITFVLKMIRLLHWNNRRKHRQKLAYSNCTHWLSQRIWIQRIGFSKLQYVAVQADKSYNQLLDYQCAIYARKVIERGVPVYCRNVQSS